MNVPAPTGGRQTPDHRLQELSASTRGLNSDYVNEVIFGSVSGQIEDQIGDPGTGVHDAVLCDKELSGSVSYLTLDTKDPVRLMYLL